LKPSMLEPARYFTWQGGRIIAVASDDLKRNAVSIPLLLWPTLMATRPLPDPWRSSVAGFLVLMAAWVVFAEPGQTTKLALVVGSLSFILARFLRRAALIAITAAWVSTCLGAVPAAFLLHRLDLQHAHWLQLSGQLRVFIWNDIAHLFLGAPLLGVGADMTYVLKPVLHELPTTVPALGVYAIPHPHNVYLQVWFELGLVGALLFLATGLCCLTKIARARVPEGPYAFALFAASATLIGSSYGMWQIWFMCQFAFIVALYGLARKFA
jgi:O-antigen ligase